MRKFKEIIFSYYWIILILSLGIYYFAFCSADINKTDFTVLGPLLALGYFIHKQKLDEARFFIDMFRCFNERYDQFNEDLNEIMKLNGSLNEDQKKILIDYYNLCSEEYLMFITGYIPTKVWRSWRIGMKHYFSNSNILNFIAEEMESDNSDSYYGLSLKIINR